MHPCIVTPVHRMVCARVAMTCRDGAAVQKSYNYADVPATNTARGIHYTSSTYAKRPTTVPLSPRMFKSPSVTVYSKSGTRGYGTQDSNDGNGYNPLGVVTTGEAAFSVKGGNDDYQLRFHWTAAAAIGR